MSRPKKVAYHLQEKLRKIREAGLPKPSQPEPPPGEEGVEPLPDRIRRILQLVRKPSQNT